MFAYDILDTTGKHTERAPTAAVLIDSILCLKENLSSFLTIVVSLSSGVADRLTRLLEL